MTPNDIHNLPETIRSIRMARGETQSQFSRVVGVTATTLRNWESGRTTPDAFNWNRVLEIAPDYWSTKAKMVKHLMEKNPKLGLRKAWRIYNEAYKSLTEPRAE